MSPYGLQAEWIEIQNHPKVKELEAELARLKKTLTTKTIDALKAQIKELKLALEARVKELDSLKTELEQRDIELGVLDAELMVRESFREKAEFWDIAEKKAPYYEEGYVRLFLEEVRAAVKSIKGEKMNNKWRLPARQELESLLDLTQFNLALPQGHPFTNVQSNNYWSSTSYAYNTNYAWVVGMSFGGVVSYVKTFFSNYVWPVRAGQCGPLGDSTISRFVDNGDTVNDNLTGLEWMKDANITGKKIPWQEAMDYVAALNSIP